MQKPPSDNLDHKIPGFTDIQAARDRIRQQVHQTPVLTSNTLNQMTDAEVFLKAENFQKGGAFKIRGATNAISLLSDKEAPKGVATHSSGNHAQALALAARERGIPAFIVMPSNAPTAKRSAVEAYGGQITFCEPTLEARENTLDQVVKRTGATFIHPYDDPGIIAGQGTAALELLEEVADLDIILAPVGGGGLLSGTILAAKGIRASVRVMGVEPELADDAYRSLKEGKRLPPNPPKTIADGLRTALGALNFSIIRDGVEEIILVSDQQILEAMRMLWERVKIVVEPSGAVPLAAAMHEQKRFAGLKIGLILSGGNVDLCRNELCNYWK